jgi:hypothetical protein
MSGTTPWFWKPQKAVPVRPKPVCTSSAMHTPPCARTICRYQQRQQPAAQDTDSTISTTCGLRRSLAVTHELPSAALCSLEPGQSSSSEHSNSCSSCSKQQQQGAPCTPLAGSRQPLAQSRPHPGWSLR